LQQEFIKQKTLLSFLSVMLFAIGTACCRAISTGMGQLLLLLAYEATDAAATAFRFDSAAANELV
jgi:hypothetical protein